MGEYGKVLDSYFRSLIKKDSVAPKVTSVSVCGSSPSNWMANTEQLKKTNCGYWRKSQLNGEVRKTTHPYFSFENEFSKAKPDLVVFTLGTNMLVDMTTLGDEITKIGLLTKKVIENQAQCVWVGPPDTLKPNLKPHLKPTISAIEEVVKKNGCHFIDSTKITVYPDIKAVTKKGNKGVSNTDGIHYTPNGSTQWGSKVVEIIKTLPLVSNTKGTIAAPTVVPNPPPKIEKPKSIIKNQSPPNPESSAGSI